MKAQALLVVLVVLLTSASCGSDDTTCRFPIEFVIAEGNTLTYVCGDFRIEWTAGDHVTLDVIADTFRVNGFAHYPHPEIKLVWDEEYLKGLYGDVPFVRATAESLVNEALPWNLAVSRFGAQQVRIARAAHQEFQRTGSVEAAKAVLLASGLVSEVRETTYGGLPVLEYWFEGLSLGGSRAPTVLELQHEILPPVDQQSAFDPRLACSIGRRLQDHLTDTRVANTMILKGGNLEDHGRAVSRSDQGAPPQGLPWRRISPQQGLNRRPDVLRQAVPILKARHHDLCQALVARPASSKKRTTTE